MADMKGSADSGSRRSFGRATDVVVSVWNGARTLVARSGRWRITDLSRDAAGIGSDLRRRVERVVHDLEGRRTRTLAQLEERMARLADAVARRAPVSRGEVAELRGQLVDLEQRLEAIIQHAGRKGGSARQSGREAAVC